MSNRPADKRKREREGRGRKKGKGRRGGRNDLCQCQWRLATKTSVLHIIYMNNYSITSIHNQK
jgi:hypothetical protein